MANIKSAKKRIKQTIKKNLRNSFWKTTIRTYFKKAIKSIEDGKHDEAKESCKQAEIKISKAVSKGVFKKETASRKISKLNAYCKKTFLGKEST